VPARGTARGIWAQNPALYPPFFSDLVAWYIAGIGITLGAPPDIVMWSDQRGTNPATQSGAANLCPHAGTGAYGPYVRFDGTDDFLDVDSLAAQFSGSDKPVTVGVAASDLDIAAVRCVWSLWNSGDTNPKHRTYMPNVTGALFSQRTDDTGANGSALNAAILSSNEYLVDSFDGTTRAAYTRTGSVSDTENVGTCTFNKFSLGKILSVNYFKGDLHEVLVYGRGFSATEAAQLQAYLAYWGF